MGNIAMNTWEWNSGEAVPMENGGSAQVVGKLGEGGQGTVYKVTFEGKDYALKWYHSTALKDPAAFRNNLKTNIDQGSPSADFLWPQYLTAQTRSSFGYLMDLRPGNFKDVVDFLNAKIDFNGLYAALGAALNIVHAFRDLHQKGMSYQDLNDGGFFIDPKTGAILICDNDNVAPDGSNTGIGGKPGYMAPEVVRGEKKPNILTDYHSLAVILFKLFLRHDPLMGLAYVSKPCITEEAELELYGTKPVFIFDPANASNRPVAGVHPNPIKLWPRYPQFIQDLFVKAFSGGMKDPNSRPSDNDWQKALIRLRGEILTCPACGYETFASTLAVSNNSFRCPKAKCGCEHSFPLLLEVGTHQVYLFPGSRIYRCHTGEDSGDYRTETGRVVQNKKNPGIWGLRNLSDTLWQTQGATGQVGKDGVVPISPDVEIQFNPGTKGRITRRQK